MKDWEQTNFKKYDTACKGSSAQVAALSRNLLAEVAKFNGLHSLSVFNDFHNFFDTIDLRILIKSLLKLSYPLRLAALALQQHSAPRVLKCTGFVGDLFPFLKVFLLAVFTQCHSLGLY